MKQEKERLGASSVMSSLIDSENSVSKGVQKRNGIYRLRKYNSPKKEAEQTGMNSPPRASRDELPKSKRN